MHLDYQFQPAVLVVTDPETQLVTKTINAIDVIEFLKHSDKWMVLSHILHAHPEWNVIIGEKNPQLPPATEVPASTAVTVSAPVVPVQASIPTEKEHVLDEPRVL